MNPSMLSRVEAYLAHRRALGFQLKIQGRMLLDLARYVDARDRGGPLTRQMAIDWACSPKQASRFYWAKRLGVVRVFAQYLLLTDSRTQLPPRGLFGSVFRRSAPHIYSPAQIGYLMRRAATLAGRLRPHTFRCLIGLLACSGLRISEALRLKIEDVDLQQALLVVRESKYGKSRVIPLHRTAVSPLQSYARRRQKLFPLAEHFFVSEFGVGLGLHRVQEIFKGLRVRIPYQRRPPRLHDLRHTMASRVLQRWQASQKGALHRVPILCRYLGHDHIRHTYWYLTASPQLLKAAAQRFGSLPHEKS